MPRNTVSYDSVSEWQSGFLMPKGGQATNAKKIEQAKKMALRIIDEQLTARQKQLLLLYFFSGQTMTEIGTDLGINKSTVSRTVARALRRLNERMRYYDLR